MTSPKFIVRLTETSKNQLDSTTARTLRDRMPRNQKKSSGKHKNSYFKRLRGVKTTTSQGSFRALVGKAKARLLKSWYRRPRQNLAPSVKEINKRNKNRRKVVKRNRVQNKAQIQSQILKNLTIIEVAAVSKNKEKSPVKEPDPVERALQRKINSKADKIPERNSLSGQLAKRKTVEWETFLTRKKKTNQQKKFPDSQTIPTVLRNQTTKTICPRGQILMSTK